MHLRQGSWSHFGRIGRPRFTPNNHDLAAALSSAGE